LLFGGYLYSTLLSLKILSAKNGLSFTLQALFFLQKGFSLSFLDLETFLFSEASLFFDASSHLFLP
jgi:hypothetical protein